MNPNPEAPISTSISASIKGDYSFLVIACCFCVGMLLSAFAYHQYVKVDEDRLHQRLWRGTEALVAYASVTPPSPSMIRIQSTLEQFQQAVLAGQPITQEFLESFTFPAGPISGESVNLRYIPKVTLNAVNDRFEMLDTRGERREFPYRIMDQHWRGLAPAGDAAEYYPILLEAAIGGDNSVGIPGVNLFHDDQFHLVMDQARDSGMMVARTSFPQITASEPYVIGHYYMSLYTPGSAPQNISERRLRHTGYIAAVSFMRAEGFINMLPESYLGLEAAFIPESEAFNFENFDPELQAIMDSETFAKEKFTTDMGEMHIVARPSLTLQEDMATPNRWWALSIGVLLTTWICSLLYLSRIRAKKLSSLVEEKTRDLVEHSRRLSEVNEALRQSEIRYRMLADNVSDVIFTHDMHGICTYISPSITQQNGFAPEDYIGKPIYIHFTEEDEACIRESLREGLPIFEGKAAIPSPKTWELHSYCKNGSIKVLETTVTALCDKEGNAIGYLGVSRDITDRKRNEEEKTQLEAAFQQAQKMEAIGTLAGGIAHDFNNLLTGILGHAELLKSTLADPDSDQQARSRSVETIESAALRARELTSQLLGFARKGHYQKVPVSINQVLRDTVSFLQRTLDKSISINFENDDQELVVTGDPGQISQVFINLAVNARDAMPEGGVLGFSLTTETIENTGQPSSVHLEPNNLPSGPYCKVTVSDTGSGIPASELNRIFEPFYTSKPKGKGTGLGLAMVYGVTENHGGTITVQSEQGAGTRFVVYLPLSKDKYKAPEKNADKDFASGQGNILVIDDEELIRGLAEAMLSNLGYQSVGAVDGYDGVNYYRQHQSEIDLAIVDVNMPNMGGQECVEKLIEINPEIKIILSTGYSQASIAGELEKPNVRGFLQKPFSLRELAQMLADILGRDNNAASVQEDTAQLETAD